MSVKNFMAVHPKVTGSPKSVVTFHECVYKILITTHPVIVETFRSRQRGDRLIDWQCHP